MPKQVRIIIVLITLSTKSDNNGFIVSGFTGAISNVFAAPFCISIYDLLRQYVSSPIIGGIRISVIARNILVNL